MYLAKKWDEASRVFEKLIQIERELAKKDPDKYLALLVEDSARYGFVLYKLNRKDEVAQPLLDAVSFLGRYGQEIKTDAYSLRIAQMANNIIGNFLEKIDETDPTVDIDETDTEMLIKLAELQRQIYRNLSLKNPNNQEYIELLVYSLMMLGDLYQLSNSWDKAVEVAEEAVMTSRRLVEKNPQKYTPELASSFYMLAEGLFELGRHEEALKASEEAVKLYRQLTEDNPDEYLPELAPRLNNLGNRLSDLGRHEEALEASEEAVRLYRQLAEENPKKYLPDLASSLNNLGVHLSDLGRHEGALRATEEAVEL